ncbi:OmpA family protein [Rhodoplanes sp. TEM]|uniref:OmpA family protein n=1 Tax=Rhodoplanes tepidamans TaxID=200616 RepID=A0ABT5JBJ4_RHOTP|nr:MULTISPECIES: OmpA family protein [Rhodoplanes]MDC7786986.1 OmpA family protein [Rhodoplanes tepidamans]MDC7982869.1 OmpA family protein [Rhodoplanes sp. TEM]MDQ0354290.1 outer membrane protein OmpA-like peptidoglycan-associated protein [Rhodoplanes tepidamans]
MTRALFDRIERPKDGVVVEIVVDPLVDGKTGLHTASAAQAGRRAAEIARAYPHLRIVPFTPEALARKPLLLIGTITAVQNAEQGAGQAGGADAAAAQTPGAYTVWFTLADTGTNRIVAKAQAPAVANDVNASPLAAEADSPAWRREAATAAYIESCRETKVGEELRPAYVAQLPVAAVVADANRAYAAKRYKEALALYRRAAAMPEGEQLRVLNGVYLALDRLGRKTEAEAAFARLIDHGLGRRDLAVKILFRPGTPEFVRTREARAYPMWLSRIAARAAAGEACLEIVGHTSPTGPAAVNERLSALRAETVRDRLDSASRGLGPRLVARGAGSRETIVGTGRDDASDALDRRVEFKVMSCS